MNAERLNLAVFLFNKSKFFIPENSILTRCNPITPTIKGSKKLKI